MVMMMMMIMMIKIIITTNRALLEIILLVLKCAGRNVSCISRLDTIPVILRFQIVA
jgi:hypothetical protein